MKHATDVTGILGWGLRRYAWLITLFVIALGIVVPGVLERAPAQYEASAQVGPAGGLRLTNLDVLPRMGTDVFRSVPDSAVVKEAAGVPESEDLPPEQLELVAAQDNIIFTVLGRGSSPEVAQDIANVAAADFVTQLNLYSQPVGSFAVSRLATPPTESIPRLEGPLAWAIGIASGLLAGFGTVALLLLLRRPVLDAVTAGLETGAPVLGRITLGRGGASGMTKLCHRILSQPTGMVLMVGPPDTRRDRQELADELVGCVGHVRRVIAMGSREPVDDYGSASLAVPSGTDELFLLADASPVEVATRPDQSLTLLVLREGIPRTSLRELAQQYLDGGDSAVVLLRREPLLSSLRHRRQRGGGSVRATRHHARPAGYRDDAPLPFVDSPADERAQRTGATWVQD